MKKNEWYNTTRCTGKSFRTIMAVLRAVSTDDKSAGVILYVLNQHEAKRILRLCKRILDECGVDNEKILDGLILINNKRLFIKTAYQTNINPNRDFIKVKDFPAEIDVQYAEEVL